MTKLMIFVNSCQVLFRGKSPDLEAYGVEYVRHGVRKRAFAKKEVIVSAGTVMSPHLLMHSGIGPRKQLEENQVKEVMYLHIKQQGVKFNICVCVQRR